MSFKWCIFCLYIKQSFQLCFCCDFFMYQRVKRVCKCCQFLYSARCHHSWLDKALKWASVVTYPLKNIFTSMSAPIPLCAAPPVTLGCFWNGWKSSEPGGCTEAGRGKMEKRPQQKWFRQTAVSLQFKQHVSESTIIGKCMADKSLLSFFYFFYLQILKHLSSSLKGQSSRGSNCESRARKAVLCALFCTNDIFRSLFVEKE